MASTPDTTPFDPTFDSEKISALRNALSSSRPPLNDALPEIQDPSEHGITPAFASALWTSWQNTFDWSTAAAKIAQWPHFLANFPSPDPSIEKDLFIHFIHQRSSNPNAIPLLLLLHGRPGSFYEFSEVIDPLSDPSATLSFHIIVPSLPGFVFSSAPPRAGWTVKDTARIFHQLMLSLDYQHYAVQAGDWGAMFARELGTQYSESCRVMHLNWCPGSVPEAERGGETEREKKCREQGEGWRNEACGLCCVDEDEAEDGGLDCGHAGGVGGYEEASNPAVHHKSFWLNHIHKTMSLYYMTNCIASSALIYYENPRHDQFAAYCSVEENLIRCPVGYTSMEFDTAPNSRRGAETTVEKGELVWYKERDYAGHFACLEDPESMIEDVREVVGNLWER
ncbi:epoxide hydrolase like protein [Zymoseptoria brevis]|uniref:Epoxide hydrolase like protein n=1 Tax=Zymoseptoria brevis TaxID=1047168 RepID=A0A0F4GLX7_9PEZI|nr:epoxide hydrolase like protein [Zymoseptoria brevis]